MIALDLHGQRKHGYRTPPTGPVPRRTTAPGGRKVVGSVRGEERLRQVRPGLGASDGEAADQLGELLVDLNCREGVTLITVTHSDRLAACMQRTLKLTGGALTQHTVGA